MKDWEKRRRGERERRRARDLRIGGFGFIASESFLQK
jgi:hypothetical protein